MIGNNRYGNAHRGVTQMTLDSFRVYTAAAPYLDSAAAVRAFQCAIKMWDRVIVAEIQSTEGEKGAIASPGSAHKSIGVGAYDVVSCSLS